MSLALMLVQLLTNVLRPRVREARVPQAEGNIRVCQEQPEVSYRLPRWLYPSRAPAGVCAAVGAEEPGQLCDRQAERGAQSRPINDRLVRVCHSVLLYT